jgi:hypothetical protein
MAGKKPKPDEETIKKKGYRYDEPFILRGQHKYRFGWHKWSDTAKVYRAFKPLKHGVLVVRDVAEDDALTLEDYQKTSDAERNPSINIHWSGKGVDNWSAGCQVIAGQSYIAYTDKTVDCSSYAANDYSSLGSQKTRAAYNVLTDLITVFSNAITREGGDVLYYTLIYDEDLDLLPEIGKDFAEKTLKRLKPT